MRCQDIERLIIRGSETELSLEEARAIEGHVSSCAKCARFQEDLEGIRLCLRNSTKPVLSDELSQRTQEICYAEMRSLAATRRPIRRVCNHSIPKFVWAAIGSLIIITGILSLPLIRDIELEQSFSFPAVVVLFLIVQNAAMLLFAPVIFRKFRGQNHHFGSA